ncbi:MAG: endolytic transglycosylase MltG [Bacteroidota bacterium]
MSKKKLLMIRKIMWIIVIALAVIVASGGYYLYRELLQPNVTLQNKPDFVLIYTGSTFTDVVQALNEKKLLINEKSFVWTATQMKYVDNIKPGRYLVKPRMNNKELVGLLRSGKQAPVQVVFNNIRTKDQLAERISLQLEAKAHSITNLMNDEDYLRRFGFTSENVLSLFIPNTYEFYWNTSADQFLQRMKKEYDKFWTEEKQRKANTIGFKPVEVSILASIVQQETNKEDEKNLIAGVYINRYHKGMKLEADPTLVYALGNFTINRVLNIYKQIDSRYNTYKYAGLPPGPICLPTKSSIDAVLNYTHHNFIYFCAKEDFSGHHAFAATYSQHLVNAKRFQRALDRRGIKS